MAPVPGASRGGHHGAAPDPDCRADSDPAHRRGRSVFGLRHGESPDNVAPRRRAGSRPAVPADRLAARHRPGAEAASARSQGDYDRLGCARLAHTSSVPALPPIPAITRRPRARCAAHSRCGRRAIRPRSSGSGRSPTPGTSSPPRVIWPGVRLRMDPYSADAYGVARRRADPARPPRGGNGRHPAHARPPTWPRRLRPRLLRPSNSRAAWATRWPLMRACARRRGRPSGHRVLPLPAR